MKKIFLFLNIFIIIICSILLGNTLYALSKENKKKILDKAEAYTEQLTDDYIIINSQNRNNETNQKNNAKEQLKNEIEKKESIKDYILLNEKKYEFESNDNLFEIENEFTKEKLRIFVQDEVNKIKKSFSIIEKDITINIQIKEYKTIGDFLSYKINFSLYENDMLVEKYFFTKVYSLSIGSELLFFNNDLENQKIQLLNFVKELFIEKYSVENEKFSYLSIEDLDKYLIVNNKVRFFIGEDFFADVEVDKIFEIFGDSIIEIKDLKRCYDYKMKTMKYVALTFDDGPNFELTTRLIDELNKHDAKATFFVNGKNANKNHDTLRKMAEGGHEIANHTYSHHYLTRIGYMKIVDEIKKTNDIIFSATGVEVKLLRPPYGATNKNVLAIAEELNMAIVLWNVDTRDWESRNAEKIKNAIINNSKRGDIVLLHDIHEASVYGAIQALQILSEGNYKFVTVSELLSMQGEIKSGETYWKANI